MIFRKGSLLRRAFRDENGQMVIWTAVLIPLIFAMGGLVVDIGHAYVCYRELQATTDAAALAAAAALPNGITGYTVTQAATSFSSVSGNINAFGNLNSPQATSPAAITVTPLCITSISNLPQCPTPAVPATWANAVRVVQTVSVPTYFIRALAVFGITSTQSFTLRARGTAAMRGGGRGPYDVAIIIDTTPSMAQSDGGANCTGTKIACALQGAQILLSQLSPCMSNLSSCGTVTARNVADPTDQVALFTFPAQTAGTQTRDYSCPSTTPSIISYPDTIATTAYPLTTQLGSGSTAFTTLVNRYQVVPLSSDYRTSDNTTTPNYLSPTTSNIAAAVGGNSYYGGSTGGCTGMQAPSNGALGTFFAGALYAAQQYLGASGRTAANNVMVILSDGDANNWTSGSGTKFFTVSSPGTGTMNTNGTYPSYLDPCQQAVAVAKAAKSAGTIVYVVGNHVDTGGCQQDTTNYPDGTVGTSAGITACTTLRKLATDDAHFFLDSASTRSGSCSYAQSVSMNGQANTLAAIFTAIVGQLTKPHLIPDNIT